LVPGTIKKIGTLPQPFIMMVCIVGRVWLMFSFFHSGSLQENIESYIKACKSLGIPDFELFMTVDLYEARNMNAVR
jgi:hypothetical protein